MKTPVFAASGAKKTSQMTLDAKVFGLKPNAELLAQAYRTYLANQRTNNASTLTRGLVSGGGKKPYRQKGTGRARTGSIRNPIWRGGGITFGPTGIENYSRKLPKKMAQAAILQALSAKADIVQVIEAFSFDAPKTSAAVALLDRLDANGNIVIITAASTSATRKSVANIPFVEILEAGQLNVFDLMNADTIIIEQAALDLLGKGSTPAKTEAKPTKSAKAVKSAKLVKPVKTEVKS